MRIWNIVYFKPGLFEPDQSQSAAWNRGGYLVTGLGHCGACHTPKNYFGADKTGAGTRRATRSAAGTRQGSTAPPAPG